MPVESTNLQEDRWLPEKLARVGVFIEIEKKIYGEYAKAVESWLSLIRDKVLTAFGTAFGTIDPNGVFTAKFQWLDLIEQFIDKAVRWAFGKTYESVMGHKFEFSNRPYVEQYLTGVRNRLVATPDEIYRKVKETVSAGIEDGSSIPDIAKGIKEDLLTSGAPYWKNRATTVARTETIGAYNGGTFDAFNVLSEVIADVQYEKVWLATDDSRTRHTHDLTDGQRVPLSQHFAVGADPDNGIPGVPMMFPGDPAGPAHEVINCRCTLLLVTPDEEIDYTNRQMKASAGSTANALVASALHLTDNFAHALVAAIITDNWGLHTQCGWTFCRAPLHPGPCKGWKHKLRQVAPGVYDALEKVRIQKLEEKRKAKIKALKDAGLPVPKKLLQKTQPLPLPQPAPGDTSKPDQPPLSQVTEDKLKKVSQKVKDVNEQAKKAAAKKAVEPAKTGPKDGDGDGKLNEKADQKAPPEAAPGDKLSYEANTAANVAFAPQHYPVDERINAYEDLDTDDISMLGEVDLENVVADILALDADQGLSPYQRNQINKIIQKFKDHIEDADQPNVPVANPLDNAGQATDLHAKPPSSVDPEKIGNLDAPNAAAIAQAQDVLDKPHKYSINEQLAAYAGLSKKDFDSLPLAKQKDIANKLKHYASSPGVTEVQRQKAVNTAQDLGAPNPLGTPAQIAAMKVIADFKNTSVDDRLDAYAQMDQAEFEGLSVGGQISIRNDLKNITKGSLVESDDAQKTYAKDIVKQLTGKGKATKPKPADSTEPLIPDSLGELLENFGQPAAPDAEPVVEEDANTEAAQVDVTKPPIDSFAKWQEAKQTLGKVTWPSQKSKAAKTAATVSTGQVHERIAQYQQLSPTDFKKFPTALQEAIVADLDNIFEGADKGYFTDSQKTLAKITRQLLTGADPGTAFEPKAPTATAGKIVTFVSPAAEKAHHTVENVGVVKAQERFDVYDKLTKEEFESLAPATQKKIVADLLTLTHYQWLDDLGSVEKNKIKDEVFPKLVGKPFGAPFTPKSKTLKKFASPGQEAGYEASLNVGDGDPKARLDAYQQMTKDEFEALPGTVQKIIAKDLGDMIFAGKYTNTEYKEPFGNNPDNKDTAKDLMVLFTGTTSSYNFKPKTKAQKEYEKLGDAYFQPSSSGGSGNVVSETEEVYKKKIAIAKKKAAALAAAPLSLTNNSDWSWTTPNVSGYEAKNALGNYKGSGYIDMNDELRQIKGDFSKWPSYNTHTLGQVRAADVAFERSALTDPVVTLRGFGTPEKVWPGIWNGGKTDLTGMEWIEHGYSSTTTNPGTANSFANVQYPNPIGEHQIAHAGNRVVMQIFTPKGIKGIKLSGPEFEYEMVLERGLKYRVIADHGVVDGARRIDVEVIGVSK